MQRFLECSWRYVPQIARLASSLGSGRTARLAPRKNLPDSVLRSFRNGRNSVPSCPRSHSEATLRLSGSQLVGTPKPT
jgi:hypothetical protein